MVRRVKLDLLEIEPEGLAQAPISTEMKGQPAAAAETSEEGPRRVWPTKLLLIGSGLFLLLSIGATLWFQFGGHEQAPVAQNTPIPSAAAHAVTLTNFQNFAVDFKDAQGQYKVLLCDVAVETNPGVELPLDAPEMRKVIYRTLHTKNIQDLTVPKGKKAIKKDVEAALNQAIGGASVKQVYFTRFTLM